MYSVSYVDDFLTLALCSTDICRGRRLLQQDQRSGNNAVQSRRSRLIRNYDQNNALAVELWGNDRRVCLSVECHGDIVHPMEEDRIIRFSSLVVRYKSFVVVSVLFVHEHYGRSWVAGGGGAVVAQLWQLL